MDLMFGLRRAAVLAFVFVGVSVRADLLEPVSDEVADSMVDLPLLSEPRVKRYRIVTVDVPSFCAALYAAEIEIEGGIRENMAIELFDDIFVYLRPEHVYCKLGFATGFHGTASTKHANDTYGVSASFQFGQGESVYAAIVAPYWYVGISPIQGTPYHYVWEANVEHLPMMD